MHDNLSVSNQTNWIDPVIRHRCKQLLADELGHDNGDSEQSLHLCAARLEQQLFVSTYQRPAEYMEKFIELVCKYPAARKAAAQGTPMRTVMRDVFEATLAPSGSAPQETCNAESPVEAARELLEVITQDEQRDTNCRSTIQCNKCKSYEVDIECKQTRSADEPATIFCTCMNPDCRASWRLFS